MDIYFEVYKPLFGHYHGWGFVVYANGSRLMWDTQSGNEQYADDTPQKPDNTVGVYVPGHASVTVLVACT